MSTNGKVNGKAEGETVTARELARRLGERKARSKPRNPRANRTGDPVLGHKLHELRMVTGLRQCDAADALGITRPGLANIEAGRAMTTLPTLARMAAFYEVSLDDLAGHMVGAVGETGEAVA